MWVWIDPNECYECGSKEDVQQHHVVAKSRGGTKTFPLCGKCHRVGAHGMKSYSGDHSRLTREGIARAKARGWVPDTSHLEAARGKAEATRKRNARLAALTVTAEYYGLLVAHAEERQRMGEEKPWFTKHGTFKKREQVLKLQGVTTRGAKYTRLTLHQAHQRAVEATREGAERELVRKYLFGDPSPNITLSQTFTLDEDLISSLKKCIMILDETRREYES
jgi:hypothetical protein